MIILIVKQLFNYSVNIIYSKQRMNIHLYPRNNKKYNSAQFSTRPQQNTSSSRMFLAYREEGCKTSRSKVYNLNDSQKRIKRQHRSLLKQSTEQSALFEKGIRRINQNLKSEEKEIKKQGNIKRSYRNKESHNITNPTPVIETKFNLGGVRKIYLFDQNKLSDHGRSESKKSLVKDPNVESQNKDNSNVYLVNKLPTHKGAAREWLNQIASIQFHKKENHLNKQNINCNKDQEKNKKSFKEVTLNKKNKSHLTTKEGGITLSGGQNEGKLIDFKQNYYIKEGKLKSYNDSKGFGHK